MKPVGQLSLSELDYLVATLEKMPVRIDENGLVRKADGVDGGCYCPSRKWVYGSPIIEREGIEIWDPEIPGVPFYAHHPLANGRTISFGGTTGLEAAMKAYVAAKLGDPVDVDLDRELQTT